MFPVKLDCRYLLQFVYKAELVVCCADVRGGLIDKPGKNRDFYHTCYTLSGLSLCQHYRTRTRDKTECFGDPSNLLVETHPVYNVSIEAANAATKYFNSLPTVKLGS